VEELTERAGAQPPACARPRALENAKPNQLGKFKKWPLIEKNSRLPAKKKLSIEKKAVFLKKKAVYLQKKSHLLQVHNCSVGQANDVSFQREVSWS
jgi:hypothetical protein